MVHHAVEVAARTTRQEAERYSAGQDRPLGSYVAALAAYGATTAALAATLRLSGRKLPERPAWGDMALASVATYKVARLVAKDPVTSPLRAPFTRFVGQSGPSELAEEVRGAGPRHMLGELLTCPFCLSQWAATVLAFGFVLAPRVTRLVCAVFSTVAASDFLQLAYARAQH